MNLSPDPTENFDLILIDEAASLSSTSEDINNLISGTRLTPFIYNFNASETFSDTPLGASNSLHPVLPYSKAPFATTNPNTSPHNSKDNDNEPSTTKKSHSDLLPVTRSSTEKSSQSSIALSNSVVVLPSEQGKLQLVYPLERTYRPRYKSDYYPQHGTVRRPRYIADNAGNHFITLQVPESFEHDLANCYIRVALITKYIEGHGHYYSPYKFQKDHNDIKIPDENPMYIKVETSREEHFIMRLQLVLIKSKSDQLNNAQPLQLFTHVQTPRRNIVHQEQLSPKDLITRYQLDQSHIAFTLCTHHPDGSIKLYPDTTVISSIITEASSSARKTNESTGTSTVESTQNICCPHCEYRFEADTASGSDEQQTESKASRSRSRTTTEKSPKKKKKNA